MPTTIDSTSSTTIQNLARTIMQEFDANKDGQFSSDEFASFLDGFIHTITGQNTPATQASSRPSATATSLFVTAAGTASATALTPATLPDCPPGWNATKWADLSHTTPKYVVGRVVARYQPSDWLDTAKRDAILAEIKAAGVNVTAVGKDKIEFIDGEFKGQQIDIVQGASTGGHAWQWLNVN